MNAWQSLLVICGGNVFFFLLQIAYFRFKKRENFPEELNKDLKQLQKDIVNVRGEVLYLKGRINGKEWRRNET